MKKLKLCLIILLLNSCYFYDKDFDKDVNISDIQNHITISKLFKHDDLIIVKKHSKRKKEIQHHRKNKNKKSKRSNKVC